ncbi:MAG: DUF3343 domain-containing protein [Clostridia bacterium]|nr:DUF3343 domain-containing protein [Clostridia bacterium]
MLATVASVTSANRIKRRVGEMGITSSVIQTPQSLAKDGCGYSLRFEDSSQKIISSAAMGLGIKIRAFYTETLIDGKKFYSKI